MIGEQRDKGRHGLEQEIDDPSARRIESGHRVKGIPHLLEPRPLRMRIKRTAHRRAEPHADPRKGMRVVHIDAEDERARQADHADEPRGGGDAHLGHGPEIRDDLGDAALVDRPRDLIRSALALERVRAADRTDSTRSSSAAAWWPTSCTSDEAMPLPIIRSRGTRMIATGFSPPPGSRVRARRIAAPCPRSR